MTHDNKRYIPPSRNGVRRQCPHCQAYARIRSSEAQSPLSRITWLQCTNVHCGHTWAEGSEVLYTITPSASPNPNVNIPIRHKERSR